MSARAPRTVRLPCPDGGPEIDLLPSIEVWEAIEQKFGGLGGLYQEQCYGRVRFKLMCELIWRCSRNAGNLETLKAISERCYKLGLHQLAEVTDKLWLDIMKPTEEPAGEGDADGTPLASGG